MTVPVQKDPALLLIPPVVANNVIYPPFANVCLPTGTSLTELFAGL